MAEKEISNSYDVMISKSLIGSFSVILYVGLGQIKT